MDDSFKVTLNEYLPLREVVFNNIRNAIITGALKPGQRLMEKQLAESIGVSRTPIREAMRKLETEGYVEMIPRKGALVSVVSPKDIEDVLEIRAALEGLAAKLACRYMTDEQIALLTAEKDKFQKASQDKDIDAMVKCDVDFHSIILDSAKNAKLTQIIHNLSEQFYRFRIVYLKDSSFRKSIIEEHEALLAAIAGRDAHLAYDTAVKHIDNQKKAVIQSLTV